MEEKYKHIFDSDIEKGDLKKKSLKGGAATLTSQGIMFFLRLGSTMILARILTPDDYGMMAMVVAITGLASILGNLGLSTATVQKKDITHAQVSTLFWINVALGLTVTLVMAGLSPVVAWFYKTPEVQAMMLVMSSNFFINSLAVQHQALLNRQMRFAAIAKIQILSNVIGLGSAIAAGVYGWGYWALVLNTLCTSAVSVAFTWLAIRWIPSLPKRNVGAKSMVKFGTDIVGFNIVNYFARRLDNILIGRFDTSNMLGQYSKAYQLLMMPILNLRDPLTRVAMPTLSKLQNDSEQYRNYYLKFLSILAFFSIPLVVFMYSTSDQLILFFLGEQWKYASDLFKILAIVALFQPISSTRGLVLLSLGLSRKYFYIGLLSSLVTCTSFLVGITWGAKGVAIAYAVGTYLSLIPLTYLTLKGTPIALIDFFRSILKPLFSSIFVFMSVFIFSKFIVDVGSFVYLFLTFVFSALIYFLAYMLMPNGKNDLKEYFSYIRTVFVK